MSVASVRKLLGQSFQTVYLDGRNEHGSHVVLQRGDNIDDAEALATELNDQEDGPAERILTDAESLGFEIGHFVVTIWRWNAPETDHDFPCGQGFDAASGIEYGARTLEIAPGYWEYERIDPTLTMLFCGAAEDQAREIAPLPDFVPVSEEA